MVVFYSQNGSLTFVVKSDVPFMKTPQDYLMLSFQMLGALGLLIYGMKMMSDALQKMAGPQLRKILGTVTSNRLTGMLTGAMVTCAVQSSSATTVMTVSFVSAGLLTLAQAISIIMGANIGTTLTAWIMSLGYNVDLSNVVYPAFALGMLLIYRKHHRYVGDFLFGIAFLFLSLVMLSQTGRDLDLSSNKSVVDFFASFDTSSYWTILSFLGIGTIITCIVQSSAAVMALTILLCSTGVLPIYLGIALVMGENIGTTATANLAALGAGIPARRTALAHLLFNVFGVTWVLCVFYPFVDMVCSFVDYNPNMVGQSEKLPVVLAMFHTCFNVANTAILIGFIPQMERIVCWLLPDKSTTGSVASNAVYELKYIHANLIQTPEISVMQARKETTEMGIHVQKMFQLLYDMLDESDSKEVMRHYKDMVNREDISDKMEIGIAHYLEQVSESHLSDETKGEVRKMMREVSELESIGDSCFKLARTVNRYRDAGRQFTVVQRHNMKEMMKLTGEILDNMNEVDADSTDYDIRETYRMENAINQLRNQLVADNVNAVNDRKYDYSTGTAYMDFINECERLGDYVVNVMQARFGK